MLYRHVLGGLFAVLLLGLLSNNAARADQIFVTNSPFNGSIGEYTTSGVMVNPALIPGLSGPWGIAVSGSDLFVTNQLNGAVGEYTTSGVTVNPALISGLTDPTAIVVVATVPEPSSLTLTLFGLVLGLVFRGRCRRAS